MAKWTSKYGTVIDIPDGLSAKQINEIKTQANNKYGTKAQELAKQYGAALNKSSGGAAAAQAAAPQVIQPVQPINLGVNKDGTINGQVAAGTIAGAEKQDVINTQLGQNANITDAYGNTSMTTVDPITGQATVKQGLGGTGQAAQNFINSALGQNTQVDLSGAPQILTGGDLKGTWDQAQQALYGTLTQNLDRNKLRDLEAQKQELANRGIVYNPGDTESAYGKAISAIDEKYKGYEDSALQQSIAGATDQMAANAGVNNQAYQNFVNTAFQRANNPLAQASTAAGILGSVSGNLPQYQGTQSDTSSQLLQLDALMQQGAISQQDYNLKRQALAKSGGGGGSSSGGGFSIGGIAA